MTGVSDIDQATFISETVPYMDQTSYVERYAYFFVTNGYLTNGNPLSDIGQAYNSAELSFCNLSSF